MVNMTHFQEGEHETTPSKAHMSRGDAGAERGGETKNGTIAATRNGLIESAGTDMTVMNTTKVYGGAVIEITDEEEANQPLGHRQYHVHIALTDKEITTNVGIDPSLLGAREEIYGQGVCLQSVSRVPGRFAGALLQYILTQILLKRSWDRSLLLKDRLYGLVVGALRNSIRRIWILVSRKIMIRQQMYV